jgi:DNA-binding IclR family transcriptional regulator
VASSLAKAFSVIRALRRSNGPLTVTELARGLKVAPSTVHSILRDLVNQGAAVQDPDRRYRLGPSMFYLGAAYARGVPIYRAVWNPVVDLAAELGLIAVVAVPWEGHHLMLAVHRAGRPDVEVAFGGRVPIDAGSFGKAYFAWSGSKPKGDPVVYTPKSISDPTSYRTELARARELGYTTDDEEFSLGVGAVTSAVTSERGFEGIASLIGPIARVTEIGFDNAGRRLSALTARGSLALGDPGRVKVVGED